MQLDVAFQDGYLIPWRKRLPEDFKTGSELLLTDKGGLVFQPRTGLYEQVCELDFSSMFPSIMVKYNISQETLRCACCPENRVPEIGHHICTKRRGLVPRTLEPVLERRRVYKRLMRRKKDPHFGKTCQFFDIAARRCTIYEARPFACRNFPGEGRCGYWDFLKFERDAQKDQGYISTTDHSGN